MQMKLPLPFATDTIFRTLSHDRLVIGRRDRTDTPHLTVLWGTRSGELDIHLKWEDGRAEPYESLFRQDKMALLAQAVVTMQSHWPDLAAQWKDSPRTYRPGWLRRNGYLVCWVPQEAVLERMKEAVPRRKGKYRLNTSQFLSSEGLGGLLMEHVYDPDLLKLLPQIMEGGLNNGRGLQVQALSISRRRRPPLVLTFHPQAGRKGRWMGLPMRPGFPSWMRPLVEALLPALPRFAPLYLRIFEALHLDELGLSPLKEENIAAMLGGRPASLLQTRLLPSRS
jgi:hypothetical protein